MDGDSSGKCPVMHIPASQLATGTIANATSEFSGRVTVVAAQDISGVVFQDTIGDVLNDGVIGDASNPGIAGVTVRLYRDTNTNGLPDGADVLISTQPTGVGGERFVGELLGSVHVVYVEKEVWPKDPDQPARCWWFRLLHIVLAKFIELVVVPDSSSDLLNFQNRPSLPLSPIHP